MAFFTFTVNCGVTPTPTPTPRPTPVPWCCYEYTTYNESVGSETVYFDDCAGNPTSKVVSPGYDTLPCSRQYTQSDPSGFVTFTEGTQCYTVPTVCEATPTPTPTPTPTTTPTVTPTALPTFTVGIYASLQDIPTKIIPPGSGAEVEARMYYSFGYPMAPLLLGGSISSTSCNFLGNITVAYGTTLNLGMLSYSYNTPIGFQIITNSTNCSLATTYGCGILTNGGGVTTAPITSNINIAMKVIVYANIVHATATSGKTFDYCTAFVPTPTPLP
jgi:hypothetical protein